MLTSHVSGRNMKVGIPLTTYVSDHLEQIEQKYFGEMISSNVVFLKARKGLKFECSIKITCNRGIVFASEAIKPSVYSAFNQAFSNVAYQIRRKKTIMVDEKPINVVKNNVFVEFSTNVVLDDDIVEIVDVPALYGHIKE